VLDVEAVMTSDERLTRDDGACAFSSNRFDPQSNQSACTPQSSPRPCPPRRIRWHRVAVPQRHARNTSELHASPRHPSRPLVGSFCSRSNGKLTRCRRRRCGLEPPSTRNSYATPDLLVGTKLGTNTSVAASGTVEEIDEFVAAGKPAIALLLEQARQPRQD
jgi:hypothetical protein